MRGTWFFGTPSCVATKLVLLRLSLTAIKGFNIYVCVEQDTVMPIIRCMNKRWRCRVGSWSGFKVMPNIGGARRIDSILTDVAALLPCRRLAPNYPWKVSFVPFCLDLIVSSKSAGPALLVIDIEGCATWFLLHFIVFLFAFYICIINYSWLCEWATWCIPTQICTFLSSHWLRLTHRDDRAVVLSERGKGLHKAYNNEWI